MRLLDLFSGIGGFSLAFESCGFQTTAFSEIETFPSRVLAAHWPGVPNLGDITKIRGDEIGPVDVISAGFPCQDLSVAGKRRGLAGDRSGLFWEIVRLAGETRAPWLVLENVPGLLSSNGGCDFGVVLGALDKLGYGLSWRVLDAQYFGVPQRRRRVFIVGCLGGSCPPEILFEPEGMCRHSEEGSQAGEDIAGTPGACAGGWASDTDRMTFIPTSAACLTGHQRWDATTETFVIKGAAIGRKPENGPQYGEILKDGTCYTLNTIERHAVVKGLRSGSGGSTPSSHDEHRLPSRGTMVRRLTPTECERLQGFPDGFTNIPGASDSARYRALGNAVCVPVVEWIADNIATYCRLERRGAE